MPPAKRKRLADPQSRPRENAQGDTASSRLVVYLRGLEERRQLFRLDPELSEAVAGLFAGLDLTNPPPLSTGDRDRLVALAELVARARSPVVRDSYRREIELVPDSEAPGRIVGALARLLTGLRMIGVNETTAWQVTVKTGLDSMPAARRQTLELLLSQERKTTTDIATALGLPNPTAHRVLEDLAAHNVITRESQGPRQSRHLVDQPANHRTPQQSDLFRNVA